VIQQVYFDGSKESLELSLANVLADRRLREYGLGDLPAVCDLVKRLSYSHFTHPLIPTAVGHIVPFILKNIPDLYECEDLRHVAAISLIHEEVILLRIVNQNIDLTKALSLDVGAVLQRMERAETSPTQAPTSQPRSPPPQHDPQPAPTAASPLRHPLFMSSAVGALVGLLTYWKLNRK